jgi:hypothetical protein
MGHHAIQKLFRTTAIVGTLTLWLCADCIFVRAAQYQLVTPAQNSQSAKPLALKPQAPHIRRQAQISINTELLAEPDRIAVGDILELDFFPGDKRRIQVQKVRRSKNGILSLAGKIVGTQLGTFSLTADQQHFLLNLQDLQAGYRYRASGLIQNGNGQITEIDSTQAPPSTDRTLKVPAEPEK